ILPPHILREMVRHGSAAQRNAALNTLALDATHRAQRMTMQLLAAAPRQVVTGAPPQARRTIYTAGNQETKPGTLVRSEGQAPGSDPAINEAYDGLGHTFDFYLERVPRLCSSPGALPLPLRVSGLTLPAPPQTLRSRFREGERDRGGAGREARRRHRWHLYRCRARSGRPALQRQDANDPGGAR